MQMHWSGDFAICSTIYLEVEYYESRQFHRPKNSLIFAQGYHLRLPLRDKSRDFNFFKNTSSASVEYYLLKGEFSIEWP